MKIRIGKDLNIRWSILTNNVPTPLEGRNLNLLLQDPNRQLRALSFTTEGNTIISYIPAADLTRIGDYILTLRENEGEEGQTVVDAKPAFTLVEYSTEESSEPTDPSLSVAYITLSTANLAYGITIQDVFSGEDGGTIQEGDIVPVLRDGVLTRASQAAISTPESGGKMVYKCIIHKAVPAQPRKGYAYIFRGVNFIPVFIMDDSNHLAEYVSFFRRQELFYNLKKRNPSYNCMYQVFGHDYINITFNLTAGSIFEKTEITSFNQKELIEKISLERVDPCRVFIRLYSLYSFDKDIAVFIKEDGPLYGFFNAIISYSSFFPIKMESPRFFIENNKVYCKEIPSIVSTRKDEYGETILTLANRVNVLRQKTLGHSCSGKRYNHWKVETGEIHSEYNLYKSTKRYPIKLVCGETKAFRRENGKCRGCSIHSIESNGMHLINELGGGEVY